MSAVVLGYGGSASRCFAPHRGVTPRFSPGSRQSLSARALAGLFFLSGAATLGYEVIWAQQLSLVFGGTTTGVAYVTALFMGGLAIGGAVGARLVPRIRRPLVAYAVLEALLAALAVVAILLLPSLRWVPSTVLAHLGATLLVLPCTILMGITLPILVEAVGGRLGVALGWLYGLNTLGAVAGVVLTGLVMVGALGLRGAGYVLAGLGFFVAGLAWLGGREVGRAEQPADEMGTTRPAWLLAAFATGAAGLAAEVLWTRALVTELNASTYTFTLILAVFLAGLALGAAAAGRAIAAGLNPLRLIATTQLLCALLVMFAPELLRLAEAAIPGYVGVRRVTGLDIWLSTVGVGLARTALAVLPVTFLMGWSFPLLGQIYAGPERGAAVGRFVAVNTGGAVLGALGAHFLVLPWLGLGRGFQVAGCLLALVGGAALLASDRRWAIAVIIPLAVAAFRPPAPPFLGRAAAQHRVLMVDEGVHDTTAVVELTFADRIGHRHIFSNGIAYAGNSPSAQRYMYLLGHLPSLAARGRDRALVVCVGTGQTVSAVARHDFAVIDVVDTSPVVRRTVPFFEASNDGVLRDPRVKLHTEDGRRFMAMAAPGTYDVVTLEPPPARAASVASLYSTDFYAHAATLLADGGAAAQWLPLHGLTGAELDMLTRSFAAVFPNARFVLLNPDEGALIAIRGEGATDAAYDARLQAPRVASQLRSIGVPDPRQLPGSGHLAARVGPGPLVTDNRPRIEYFATHLEWNTPVSERDAVRSFRQRMLHQPPPAATEPR